MSISAVLIVYNEARRLEATLRCVQWCDEIVVLDRGSTDETQEIARRYTEKCYQLPNVEFEPEDARVAVDKVSSEWVLAISASDLMDPDLAGELRELTDRAEFPYDVIQVPYARFVLGLHGRHSPWYSRSNPSVYRKRILKVRKDSVHGAVVLDSERHFVMKASETHCLYHLTHATVDGMMSRNMLYGRAEARVAREEKPLWRVLAGIAMATFETVVRRRSILVGWDGIVLSVAYVTYFMVRFLYSWESRMSRASDIYSAIRVGILAEWDGERGGASMQRANGNRKGWPS